MKEATRLSFGVIYVLSFVIGLLLFFSGIRTKGESIEKFNVIFSVNTIQIVGISLGGVALVALIILFYSDLKRMLKHKTN